MGKKGSWLSALKKVLIPGSKEKVVVESEKKTVKEKKKWGVGKLRQGETSSFIPLYREPSSIEQILGEAERVHHQIVHSLPSREQLQKPNGLESRQKQPTPPLTSRAHYQKAAAATCRPRYNQHFAAIKIQTAYRGYMARTNFRTLKGLVRLQRLVRGQSVRHQTLNAMRCMQLMGKIQSQIQARRVQMIEKYALQRHNPLSSNKEEESKWGKQITTQELDETDYREEWEDSMLTKEEMDARMQRKMDALIKRERALAYAHPHQLWRSSPKPTDNALMEIESGGFSSWWFNWLDGQIPGQTPQQATMGATNISTPRKSIQVNYNLLDNIGNVTPVSATWNLSPITKPRHSYATNGASTPRRSTTQAKFSMSPLTKAKRSPLYGSRTPQNDHSSKSKSRAGEFSFDVPLKDDDSLTSCPSFSVPSYMAPTVSAKAKVRAQSNPKERTMASPSSGPKKRLSFNLPQSIGSLRWTKGSLFSGKDSGSQWMSVGNKPLDAIGNMSVDSSISLPTGVGMKSFK